MSEAKFFTLIYCYVRIFYDICKIFAEVSIRHVKFCFH